MSCYLKNDETLFIENPSRLPDLSTIEEISEPIIKLNILLPHDYVGPVMTLTNEKRGVFKKYAVHGASGYVDI